MDPQSSKGKGLSLAILGGMLWGASGTAAQALFSSQALDTYWLVGIRLLFAGLLLVGYSLWTTGRRALAIWQNKKTALRLVLFGLLGMLPSQFTYFMAINYGNAATATILQFTGPLFIILFLALQQRQWPRRIDIFSILIALFGTVLLVTKGHLNQLALAPLAVLWGLLAGVSQASYTLLPRQLLRQFDAKVVTGWAMLIGSLPFYPILGTRVPALDLKKIALIAFIVVGGTLFAYLFYLTSLNYLAPATTGMLSAFEPLTATILAIILLKTHFGLAEIIGALLILATAFLQALPQKKPRVY